MYNLETIKGNRWVNHVEKEYIDYKKEYKPLAAAVTYLVYSGVSFAGHEGKYFPESMANSYSNAFQIHQKPIRTCEIHKKYIRKFTYFWYLLLVALPVDIYAHTYQFILGERGEFLEGGAFFIPYMCSHWTLLGVALLAPTVHDNMSLSMHDMYFKLLRMNLIIHEKVYRCTLRRLTLTERILEFTLFVLVCKLCIKLISI